MPEPWWRTHSPGVVPISFLTKSSNLQGSLRGPRRTERRGRRAAARAGATARGATAAGRRAPQRMAQRHMYANSASTRGSACCLRASGGRKTPRWRACAGPQRGWSQIQCHRTLQLAGLSLKGPRQLERVPSPRDLTLPSGAAAHSKRRPARAAHAPHSPDPSPSPLPHFAPPPRRTIGTRSAASRSTTRPWLRRSRPRRPLTLPSCAASSRRSRTSCWRELGRRSAGPPRASGPALAGAARPRQRAGLRAGACDPGAARARRVLVRALFGMRQARSGSGSVWVLFRGSTMRFPAASLHLGTALGPLQPPLPGA
jgi:hypothetical protein